MKHFFPSFIAAVHQQTPEDCYTLNDEKTPRENLYDICQHLASRKINENKRLCLLNELVKLLDSNRDANLGFTTEELLFCLSASLTHTFTQIRAGTLRALRHLLNTSKDLQIFNSLQLPYLLCRSLDVLLKNEEERVQALKLIRKMLSISSLHVSPALVRCLVALGESGTEDRMLRAYLAVLCEFGVLNPRLLIVCGGVSVITRNVLECHSPRIAESLCGVLLHLLERPHTRNIAAVRLDCLAAPYCDFTYRLGIMDKNK
jgi:rapamycin-insensitive companion of mTOR